MSTRQLDIVAPLLYAEHEGGMRSGGGVGYSVNVPSTVPEDQPDVRNGSEDTVAKATTLINETTLNGFDVNSPDFWAIWAESGGSVDAYIKEALPTYGLIGAL